MITHICLAFLLVHPMQAALEELKASREERGKFDAAAGKARALAQEGEGLCVKMEAQIEQLQVGCASSVQRAGPRRLLPATPCCAAFLWPARLSAAPAPPAVPAWPAWLPAGVTHPSARLLLCCALSCCPGLLLTVPHLDAPHCAVPQEHSRLYCLCKKPYYEERPMVGCDYCQVGGRCGAGGRGGARAGAEQRSKWRSLTAFV